MPNDHGLVVIDAILIAQRQDPPAAKQAANQLTEISGERNHQVLAALRISPIRYQVEQLLQPFKVSLRHIQRYAVGNSQLTQGVQLVIHFEKKIVKSFQSQLFVNFSHITSSWNRRSSFIQNPCLVQRLQVRLGCALLKNMLNRPSLLHKLGILLNCDDIFFGQTNRPGF